MNDVDLNLFKVLAELLVTRNVTQAARRLGVSQPSASRSLARLRDLFGDPLLVRSGRALVPTVRALSLEPQVRALVQTTAVLLENTGPTKRQLVVGAADYGEVVGLPLLLRAIERLGLSVVVDSRFVGGRVEELLERGEIDLFLGAGSPPLEGITQRKLLRDANVVVLRKGHPQARRRQALRFVSVSPRGPGTSIFDLIVAKSAWRPQIAVCTPHFTSALHLVRGSDLAALLPLRLVEALGFPDVMTVDPPVSVSDFWLAVYSAHATRRDPLLSKVRDGLAVEAAAIA